MLSTRTLHVFNTIKGFKANRFRNCPIALSAATAFRFFSCAILYVLVHRSHSLVIGAYPHTRAHARVRSVILHHLLTASRRSNAQRRNTAYLSTATGYEKKNVSAQCGHDTRPSAQSLKFPHHNRRINVRLPV